jgi:hypothetical protein
MVRWTVRGKDAGSVHIELIWTRLRTPHRGVQRTMAAQSFMLLEALSTGAPEGGA